MQGGFAMSLYAIADTHLSLTANKPMDSFPGWQNYVQRLEQNWNHLVEPKDFVVIAGDVSWAMSLNEMEEDLRFLHRLNGTKILLKGNHDYWWSTRKKIENFLLEKGFDSIFLVHNSAFQAGPDVVCGSRGWLLEPEEPADQKILAREVARLKLSVNAARQLEGEPVVFLHYPPVGPSGVCEEIVNVLRQEQISRCYYGHLHGNAARFCMKTELNGIHFSLISADYLEFCPILIDKF